MFKLKYIDPKHLLGEPGSLNGFVKHLSTKSCVTALANGYGHCRQAVPWLSRSNTPQTPFPTAVFRIMHDKLGELKMIKQFALRFFLLSTALMFLTACSKSLGPEDMPSSIQLGRTYYTQVTMQIEKGAFRTTNYQRGFLIPINSAVELVDITEKAIVVRVASSGQEIVVQNSVGHTNDTTVQTFEKLFGQTKVDLNRFNSLERKNIEQGTVENGMRKEAVIVAIGYPPAIGTAALEGDQWKYWSSRFNTFIVYFKGDKVDQIHN